MFGGRDNCLQTDRYDAHDAPSILKAGNPRRDISDLSRRWVEGGRVGRCMGIRGVGVMESWVRWNVVASEEEAGGIGIV